MVLTETIRNKKQIKELAGYYLHRGQLRNYVLIVMGLHTALRISDILRLRRDYVYDFEKESIKCNIIIIEKKTKKNQDNCAEWKISYGINKYAILLGSPTYFADLTPEMKAVIDRLCSCSVREIRLRWL